VELSETGGRTIRRTRSSADCKLRGKTEPNEPLTIARLSSSSVIASNSPVRTDRRSALMNLAAD